MTFTPWCLDDTIFYHALLIQPQSHFEKKTGQKKPREIGGVVEISFIKKLG